MIRNRFHLYPFVEAVKENWPDGYRLITTFGFPSNLWYDNALWFSYHYWDESIRKGHSWCYPSRANEPFYVDVNSVRHRTPTFGKAFPKHQAWHAGTNLPLTPFGKWADEKDLNKIAKALRPLWNVELDDFD